MVFVRYCYEILAIGAYHQNLATLILHNTTLYFILSVIYSLEVHNAISSYY